MTDSSNDDIVIPSAQKGAKSTARPLAPSPAPASTSSSITPASASGSQLTSYLRSDTIASALSSLNFTERELIEPLVVIIRTGEHNQQIAAVRLLREIIRDTAILNGLVADGTITTQTSKTSSATLSTTRLLSSLESTNAPNQAHQSDFVAALHPALSLESSIRAADELRTNPDLRSNLTPEALTFLKPPLPEPIPLHPNRPPSSPDNPKGDIAAAL